MNTRAKGRRNELRAKKALEDKGWTVDVTRPQVRYGQADFFGLWDIIAVKKDEVLWLQIKTNQSRKAQFVRDAMDFVAPGRQELWCYIDGKDEPRIYDIVALKKHSK